ncbi:MAG: hypothetical protein MUF87_14910 [Anaerolineae bacterium]|nr:hypothetical protein [Anaerolineae bacterium]
MSEQQRTSSSGEDITNHPQPVTRSAPPPPPERGGGCGCWIPLILAVLIALVLIGVGLFLPPISLYDRLFGTQYVMLDTARNAAASSDNGLQLVLNPADVGRDFGVALTTVSAQDFQSQNPAAGDWIAAARAAIPPYLTLQSAVYDIQTTGRQPNEVSFILQLPADVPDRDRLDVYGYQISTGRWTFLPSQLNIDGSLTVTSLMVPERVALFTAGLPDPVVIVPIDVTETLTDEAANIATIVIPSGMQPKVTGELVGVLAAGFDVVSSYRVMPAIRNYFEPSAIDTETVITILNNRALRATHIEQLTAFTAAQNFNGVFIDYRDLPSDQRENFSVFIRDLKDSLDDFGLELGVIVPAAENANGVWVTGAYDWRSIGRYADYVQVEFPLDPTVFTPGEDRLIEAMMRWGVGEVSRYKLIAGLNTLSVRQINGEFTSVSFDEGLALLGDVTFEAPQTENGIVIPGTPIRASLDGLDALPGLDTQLQMPFIEYLNADQTPSSKVWLMTGDALRFRLDQLDRFALRGMNFAAINHSGVAEDIVNAVFNYQLQMPNPGTSSELALRWRIQDANGLISEVETELNEDLVVTLEAVEGNIAINVEVIKGASSSARSGVAIAQFQPTATPTPIPTATPTPIPTATPTLAPIVPTAPSNNTGGGGGSTGGGGSGIPVVNVGPGSIAAGFEYGGHVTGASSEVAIGAMQRAGMRWMKVQWRYGPGNDPGAASAVISAAHGRGFKILLGVVGNPNDLANGGADYIQGYAQYVAGIAAQGADAIEVWNEPNIDREWPTGAISGANYTSMLAQAYTAIKAVNPNVLVISAGLAPTGAENFFGRDRVRNDDGFLQEMAAAGAVNYMDCVGVHYNEGIVPPSRTSGDPRDNFYSRYFWTMVNLYHGAFGGQKPLCFTELGYLSPEGYGSLEGTNWGWAQNTTVGQQAANLAEAIAIGSQSGKIRMIIVWNVDFTNFNANDPMAGFAMVRPGGGCPACDTIAGAR